MEWVEVTAKTIEAAKESALDHLGVDESLAEFEIVEEPKKGFFGRIKVEARVRARVRPTQPRPKVDRRRRRGPESSGKSGRGNNKGRSGRRDNRSSNDRSDKKPNKAKPATSADRTSSDGANSKPQTEGRDKATRRQREQTKPGRTSADAKSSVGERSGSPDTTAAESAVPPTGKRAGQGRQRTAKKVAAATTAGAGVAALASNDSTGGAESAVSAAPSNAGVTAPSAENKPRKTKSTSPGTPASTNKPIATGEAMQEDVTVEEQADIVWGFLEGLLDAFDVDGEITQTTIDDETVELSVLGDDLGLLIGPKGNTLQAIQELSRTAVQRQVVSAPGRVRLDVAQYRQKRREALARFVTIQAEETRDAGVQRALEPMNAADRKVVHDTVNEIDGVHTISEGQDPSRRVVIIPDGD